MKKLLANVVILICFNPVFSQRLLTSWSQQNIENYTREMYDAAQKLSATQLLEKNLKDVYWSEVFLTLNASINHHTKDTFYLKALANQLVNQTETKLKGTSRLIIWDRIITGDIIFEGKGVVFDNDIFTVAGRANQILQNLTDKNFGFVTINTSKKELKKLKNKWLKFLENKEVEEYKPTLYLNSKISEITSLIAAHAFIVSIQENAIKDQITKKCLKNIYDLEQLPTDKNSPAVYCNPDTYTYSYLSMLFGNEKVDKTKDAKWWLNFWEENKEKLSWNLEKGIFEITSK